MPGRPTKFVFIIEGQEPAALGVGAGRCCFILFYFLGGVRGGW